MNNQVMSVTQRAAFDRFYAGELGQQLASKVHVIRAKWSFAVDGGAVGTINLKDEFGNYIIIPSGSIVKQVLIDRVTVPTSTGNNGTVALTLNSTGDLLVAVDADTLSALHAGVPIGTAATMVKATAQRNLNLEIATNALLSGVLNIFVEVYRNV